MTAGYNVAWDSVSQAANCFLSALAFLERLGRDHLDVARAKANIGVAYARTGDHDAAVRMLEDALLVLDSKLGRAHPQVR